MGSCDLRLHCMLPRAPSLGGRCEKSWKISGGMVAGMLGINELGLFEI